VDVECAVSRGRRAQLLVRQEAIEVGKATNPLENVKVTVKESPAGTSR
jgi:hypothetical protein